MTMQHTDTVEIKRILLDKKAELDARLTRITANVRRGFEADSRERAQQFEDREVVDALGNEARAELAKIASALQRIERGEYGLCSVCGEAVDSNRLRAYPYALDCIDCAALDEDPRQRG